MGAATPGRSFGQRLIIAAPYLWLLVFFLVPFVLVLKISFSEVALVMPPYLPHLDLAEGWAGVKDFVSGLSAANYTALADDQLYLRSYLRSLYIAALTTALLLLIGYPIAYGMARAPRRVQPILVTLVVLPFWTSMLIRVYAWMNILQTEGPLNQLLKVSGLVTHSPVWIATDSAVLIGMVYSYLPFMVLPLYAALEKMDDTLLEAAADLGCPRWKAFWLVTFPLSVPGIIAGALLCFIPIVGEFVIPDLLGGSEKLMIGQTLWLDFFTNTDWPRASAVAVVMLALLGVPIVIWRRFEARAVEGR
jgi:putrescine transport system permease protein